MKYIKKVFGGIRLSWKRIIIIAMIAGFYAASMAIFPITKDTSFRDITVTFEVWILFGILIIMNSKSNKEAAFKCFVFFLISQPLIYLIQIPFSPVGVQILGYYKYWFIWTILTLPMGYIGYYMKKDKWWTVLILIPMLILLTIHLSTYLSEALYWFPRHLLTSLFCIASLIVYPFILKNRTARTIGLIVTSLLLLVSIIVAFAKPKIYNTVIGFSDSKMIGYFDQSYNAYLEDSKYGDIEIIYDEGMQLYRMDAKFKHGGETKLIIEFKGNKEYYDLNIRYSSYEIKKSKQN